MSRISGMREVSSVRRFFQASSRVARAAAFKAASLAERHPNTAFLVFAGLGLMASLLNNDNDPGNFQPFSFQPTDLTPLFGICNFREKIFENLGRIITGIKGRQTELIRHFDSELESIRKVMISFADGLARKLSEGMGVDQVNYNLDDHEMTHAMEEWLTGCDLKTLGQADIDRLTEILARQIGLKDTETDYLGMIRTHITDGADFGELKRLLADISAKTDAAAKEAGDHGDAEPEGAGAGASAAAGAKGAKKR